MRKDRCVPFQFHSQYLLQKHWEKQKETKRRLPLLVSIIPFSSFPSRAFTQRLNKNTGTETAELWIKSSYLPLLLIYHQLSPDLLLLQYRVHNSKQLKRSSQCRQTVAAVVVTTQTHFHSSAAYSSEWAVRKRSFEVQSTATDEWRTCEKEFGLVTSLALFLGKKTPKSFQKNKHYSGY